MTDSLANHAHSMTTATVPTAALFWGVLDLPGFGGSIESPKALTADLVECREAFEPLVPSGIENLHCAFFGIGDGLVLSIAIPIDVIQEHSRESLLRLVPAAVPSLDDRLSKIDCATLNLLTGAFEPRPIVRIRRALFVRRAAAAAALIAAALVGLQFRIARADAAAAEHRDATRSTLTSVGSRSTDDLVGEANRLRAGQRAAAGGSAARSPITSLQSVLGAWPRGDSAPRVRTESVQFTPDAATLTVIADSRADATSLVNALKAIPGWTLHQPQMSSISPPGPKSEQQAESIRLALRLSRHDAAARPPEAAP